MSKKQGQEATRELVRLLRAAASIRTTGGHSTDKLLRQVADRLERQAGRAEEEERREAGL